MSKRIQTSVLLVEDNLADARYVEEMLSPAFYEVSHASSLASAYEFVKNDAIAVVLLDLSLPDGHGLETCLTMIGYAPATPIVILTGLDDEELALDAVRLGAQDYVLKRDINESTLSRCIRYAVERKNAEEAMRQSAIQARQAEALALEATANLKLSLKASKTGVWSWDIGEQKGKTDDQVAAIFGVEPDALGDSMQYFTNRIHEDDRDAIIQAMQASIANKTDFETEYRIVWPDGGVHYIEGRGQVIVDTDGTALRLTGICTDITKQKEEQENAKRLLVLEQHEDFIATLSHDLKNPLIGADRLLKMFVDGDFGTLMDEQRQMLGLVIQSNSDMLALVKNLLDVYRLDEGAPPPDFTQVDLASLARTCISQLSTTCLDSNVDLRADFPAGNHTIWVDSIAIKRVLMNLIGNSIKFTGSGGKVTVSGSDLGKTYVLEVKDTGSGIPQKDLDRLFQRYSQAGLGKKYGSGTGLGLYLCRQLVEAHGGEISCKSIEDKETTFTVVLPTTR